MSESECSGGVLRGSGEPTSVGSIELFFDLVYVFTIIQLSHFLLEHVSWTSFARAAVLFAAVWWGWNYTAWAMNWLDPEHPAVRGLLILLMLAGLCMAVAIPHAFDDRAGVFVGAYLFLQWGRSAFMVWAFRRDPAMRRNYAMLLAWSVLAGLVWVAGVFVPGSARLVIWAVAVLLDYIAPRVGFWIPGVGTSANATWPLAEGHLAERNRLVFIIALGESVIILGTTLGGVDWTAAVIAAAIVGFATIVLLWWLYFSYRTGNAEHHDADRSAATELARGAHAYAHAVMVGGAIVVAVGIELVVAHPDSSTSAAVAWTVVGGPAIYLLGNLAFNVARYGRIPWSRPIALLALAVLLACATHLHALVFAALTMAILLILAVATGELRPARAA